MTTKDVDDRNADGNDGDGNAASVLPPDFSSPHTPDVRLGEENDDGDDHRRQERQRRGRAVEASLSALASGDETHEGTRELDDGEEYPWPEDRRAPSTSYSSYGLALRSATTLVKDALLYSYMDRILSRGADLHRRRKARMRAEGKQEGRSHSGKQNAKEFDKKNRNQADEEDEEEEEEEELSASDLYRTPKSMEAARLRSEFDRLCRERVAAKLRKAEDRTSDSLAKSTRAGSARRAPSTPHTPHAPTPTFDHSDFVRVLWGIASPTYAPAAFWQFVATIAQCATPLLVRQVLLRLEANPGRSFVFEGLPVAFALFAVSVADGLSMERQKFLSFRTGIALRSAVVNAVYDRALRLTPKGRMGLTSGEITNLVAIDAQKLFELVQEGHQVWSCPMAMVIVTVLLLLELGPSILVGMASMFLMVPLIQLIVRKMMSIRKKRVAETDGRIEATSFMLQGIKFTKLNHYEEKFLKRVMDVRARELKLLRAELSALAITFFLTVISPVLATALTFATYVLVDESNVLTASTTFTTLFLFAALRFPINYAGKLMGKAAQGIQACQRFASFFSREFRDDDGDDSDVRDKDDGDRNYGKSRDDGRSDESTLTRSPSSFPSSSYHAREDGGDGGAHDVVSSTSSSSSSSPPLSSSDHSQEEGGVVLTVKNATFVAGDQLNGDRENDVAIDDGIDVSRAGKSSFAVTGVEASVARGEILCVVGPVASGKTTLVSGLIGDITPTIGSVQVRGKVGYASQTPFILNATLRENILFGSRYDEARYRKVLDACCLLPDLDQIGPARDLTEIGERGVTLSGGQKQRVSLARVAYASPDVAVFDDPLSALDASTGKRVFEKLFESNDADLLGRSATVLVTHASHFLRRVDRIVVLVDGKAAYCGDWEGLRSCSPRSDAEKDAIDSILSAVQEEITQKDDDDNVEALGDGKSAKNGDKAAGGTSSGGLMTTEEREHGLSDWRTWIRWFKHAGGPLFAGVVVFGLGIDRFFYVATEWWLASWTSAAYEPIERFGRTYPAQTEGRSAQFEYLEVYAIVFVISCAAAIFRSQVMIKGGARSSKELFALMTSRVLRAPMWYFETTPFGRILSRFTYDTEVCDQTLPQTMSMLMTSMGWFWAGVILQSTILPWQLFALGFIMLVYLLVLMHYRKSAVDLQRLDAVSRSPVQAQLSEAIDGTSTIRVFGKAAHFSKIFRSSLDGNSSAMMNFMAAQRWMSSRIQLVGATSVLFSVCFVVAFNDVLRIPPGLAGMLIIWSANFMLSLGFMVQGLSESEAAMTSVERITDMTKLPQESETKTNSSVALDKSWPSTGRLEFDNVKLRYRPGLPLSLNGLSFTLEPGQRCGVVGRTGAGKSTLTVALFRLVEIESGRISLDGIDLSTIGLADVRGRKNGMTIIPQDPVLFSGTLRECLDPFGEATDEEVLDALQAVRIGDTAVRGMDALKDYVEEGGQNYSVGERQLLCLARAVLAKPKLLVLDEATASVDSETDAFIQKMLRTRFQGTTLLTIAHRLHTIMDYDVVLSMDNGGAAEFGSPKDLLSNRDGLFSSLVDSTGKESSAALRAVALAS